MLDKNQKDQRQRWLTSAENDMELIREYWVASSKAWTLARDAVNKNSSKNLKEAADSVLEMSHWQKYNKNFGQSLAKLGTSLQNAAAIFDVNKVSLNSALANLDSALGILESAKSALDQELYEHATHLIKVPRESIRSSRYESAPKEIESAIKYFSKSKWSGAKRIHEHLLDAKKFASVITK